MSARLLQALKNWRETTPALIGAGIRFRTVLEPEVEGRPRTVIDAIPQKGERRHTVWVPFEATELLSVELGNAGTVDRLNALSALLASSLPMRYDAPDGSVRIRDHRLVSDPYQSSSQAREVLLVWHGL